MKGNFALPRSGRDTTAIAAIEEYETTDEHR
jgi:hypothetical protein